MPMGGVGGDTNHHGHVRESEAQTSISSNDALVLCNTQLLTKLICIHSLHNNRVFFYAALALAPAAFCKVST